MQQEPSLSKRANHDLPDQRSWHSQTADEVLRALRSDPEKGLIQAEAQQRLKHVGKNKLETAKTVRWYQILARQFVDVLIGILIVAAIISMAVGETDDAITIMAIVGLNGILGFVQEWKAEEALKALKQMLSPHCKVIRDGKQQQIDAIVPVWMSRSG